MGANFDGVGVEFGVEDDGSTDFLGDVNDSLRELWDGINRAGSAAANAGRQMGRGFGAVGRAGRRGIGGLTLAFGSLVDKAMNPELDHAYSSLQASFSKSFSAATVGMQMTAKEAKDMQRTVGSAAFAMGEDMDQAANSWLAFEKQAVEVNEVLGSKGMKGAVTDLIKVTSVFGIEGQQLAQVMGQLKTGFGFTEQQIGQLGDKIFMVGKQFNIGREAMQSWPGVMETVNNAAADFGRKMNPKDIENLTLSIYQLGAGLKTALGLEGTAGIELARNMFETFAGERKNIMNMARGMGSEFGDVTKMLFETGGDVEGVFGTLLQGDPLRFMDFMREMGKRAEQMGGESGIAFQRLSATLNEALGPDVAFAVKGNWDKARGALAGVPAALQGSEGMLVKHARAHWKSSLTAGEAWDRMINGMKARLFQLSDKELNQNWKPRMKKGFKATFEIVKDLSKDDGPIGEMTRRFLAVRRVGLSALMPQLAGLSPLLGGIASSAIPAATALGSMGISFGSLGKMALGGGAIFALFKILKDGPEETMKQLVSFKDDFKKTFTKLFPDAAKAVEGLMKDFESGKFFEQVKNSLLKGIDYVLDLNWEPYFDQAANVLTHAFGAVGSFLKEVDWTKIAETSVRFLAKAFKAIGGFFVALLTGGESVTGEDKAGRIVKAGMGDAVIGAMSGLQDILMGTLRGFWKSVFDADSISDGLANIAKIFVGGFAALLVVSKKFRMKMRAQMSGMFAPGGAMRRAAGSIRGAGAAMSQPGFGNRAWRRRAGRRIIGGAGRAGRAALGVGGMFGAVMGGMEAIDQYKEKRIIINNIIMDHTLESNEKIQLSGEQTFDGLTKTMDAMFFGIPGMVGDALGITGRQFKDFYHEMVGGLEKAIIYVTDFFGTGFSLMGVEFNKLGKIFSLGWDMMKESAGMAWAYVDLKFTQAINGIQSALDSMIFDVKRVFLKLRHVIETPLTEIRMMIHEALVKAIEHIPERFRPDWMKTVAWTLGEDVKDFERAGGMAGLAKRQAKELEELNEREAENVKARARIEQQAQDALNQRTVNLQSHAKMVGQVAIDAAMEEQRILRNSERTREEMLRGVDQSTKDAQRLSRKFDKQVETEAAKRDDKAEKAAKKRRSRRRKGKKPDVDTPVPSAAERAAMGAAGTDDLSRYFRQADATNTRVANAVESLKNSPVKVYLDGKPLHDSMVKHQRKTTSLR
jgi:hypothetical protein